ncbi:hypothetical protein ACFY5J_04590 [Peribacillus butanolivorans]
MNENIMMLLLPPYLHQLGYNDIVGIQKLSGKCFEKGEGNWHPFWVE